MSRIPQLCEPGLEGRSADTFLPSAESAYFLESLPRGSSPRFDCGDAKARDSELRWSPKEKE